MTRGFIISGTDTGVGKTVFSAMLTLGLDGYYWKPVQSGTADGTDTQTVRKLTGLSADRFLPETYCLEEPLSPHRAAELGGVAIDPEKLVPPHCPGPLVIEGAGGLMVPLTRDTLFIDVFRRWGLPLVLCARTSLGAINHALLAVEALKKRNIFLYGIVFIGHDNPDTIRTIAGFSGARILGRLPVLEAPDREALSQIFDENFHIFRH